MSGWRCAKLAHDGIGEEKRAQDSFTVHFMAHGSPLSWALFSSVRSSGRSTYLYLSPDAAKLGSRILPDHEWKACAAPLPSEVALLVGQAGSWDLLSAGG